MLVYILAPMARQDGNVEVEMYPGQVMASTG